MEGAIEEEMISCLSKSHAGLGQIGSGMQPLAVKWALRFQKISVGFACELFEFFFGCLARWALVWVWIEVVLQALEL